jgi:hypothetical protein
VGLSGLTEAPALYRGPPPQQVLQQQALASVRRLQRVSGQRVHWVQQVH